MPLYIAKSGDLEGCHACLTDSQRKDRATQLLIKYKSGALVTQFTIDKIMQVPLGLIRAQISRVPVEGLGLQGASCSTIISSSSTYNYIHFLHIVIIITFVGRYKRILGRIHFHFPI